jgi:hypothetical protein
MSEQQVRVQGLNVQGESVQRTSETQLRTMPLACSCRRGDKPGSAINTCAHGEPAPVIFERGMVEAAHCSETFTCVAGIT